MSLNPTIREESIADIAAITGVTIAAFKTLALSSHTEQFIIESLRNSGDLSLSLVAELSNRVVGHIAFSPLTISDGTTDWYALGPVSVQPDLQRQGFGKSLIIEGLSRLKSLGARGCCLVGHQQYYPKFGFKNVSGLGCEGFSNEVFFALSFDGKLPQGQVVFHQAFNAVD